MVSETEPLLQQTSNDAGSSRESDSRRENQEADALGPTVSGKPEGRLDKFQLLIVLLIQFAEPVTATVIFPFVNQFVRETGITGGDERKTGYYAGIIESMFFITECLTVYHWGRASDQVGRKPILVAGQVGLMLAMLGFGLSTSFWMMVLTRAAQGVFNGNIGVSKSVMAEISNPTNVAYVFSFISIMWTTGTTLGPILGGVLARPADTWPDIFGRYAFFSIFPYFLPCATAALVVLLVAVLAAICMKETLPSIVEKKRTRNGDNEAAGYGAIRHDNSPVQTQPSTFMSLITERRTLIPVINMGFLAFVSQSINVLLPLMFSTSIPLGGLGMEPFEIGIIMGTWGFANGFIQLFAFNPINRALGSRGTYIVAYGNHVIVLIVFAIMSYTAKQAGEVNALVWAILVLFLLLNTAVIMAYSSLYILIIDCSTKENLGAINGLAQMAASVMRAVAPWFASSLFSISLEKKLMGGNMVYVVLTVITLMGMYWAVRLPKERSS